MLLQPATDFDAMLDAMVPIGGVIGRAGAALCGTSPR